MIRACHGKVAQEPAGERRVILVTAANPEAPWWTMDDIAVYWGIRKRTVEYYRDQSRNHGHDYMPVQDSYVGRTPVWFPRTITGWPRPGQGSGGGRPRKARLTADSRQASRPGNRARSRRT